MTYVINTFTKLLSNTFINKFKNNFSINYDNLFEIRKVSDDEHNNVKNADIWCTYYYMNKEIGYINYRISVGQIGHFWLDPEFRNKGIGKEIFKNIIKEMKYNNLSEVWCVCSKDNVFWKNVFNQKMIWKDPVHKSVTGHGYILKI